MSQARLTILIVLTTSLVVAYLVARDGKDATGRRETHAREAVGATDPAIEPAQNVDSTPHFQASSKAADHEPVRSFEWILAHADELGVPHLSSCRSVDGRLDGCGACLSNADCQVGAACSMDWSTRRTACVANECDDDEDCPPNEQCLLLTGTENAGGVHRCFPHGQRMAGDACDTLRRTSATSCSEGLACILGFCRDLCGEQEPCEQDETCVGDYDGWGCMPTTCVGVSCPDGYRCLEGRCLKGPDCRDPKACPEGTRCMARGSARDWVASCLSSCSAEEPCADGQVCDAFGACLDICDPERPESCGSEGRCISTDETGTAWGCEQR